MTREPLQRPAGHPRACICTACGFAELDEIRIGFGLEPLGFDGDPFVRVPRAYVQAVLNGGRVPVVLPDELEHASAAELYAAGALEPVPVHVEDVAAGMFCRVQGLDPAGDWVDVTGYIGRPADAGDGLVSVPVIGVGLVLVDADARLELAPEPWDPPPAVELGEPYRVDLLNVAGEVERSVPVSSLAEVDALARDHHPDPIDPDGALAPALYCLNWRGQR